MISFIKIIYWFLCYTITFTTVLVSAFKTLITIENKDIESAHFLMIFSFFLLMFGSTIYSLLNIENKILETIFNIFSMAGVCLGIFAIPNFALILSEDKSKFKNFLKFILFISLLLFLLIIFFYIIDKFNSLIFISVYFIYFFIIAFTCLRGLLIFRIRFLKYKHKNESNNLTENNISSKNNFTGLNFWEIYIKKIAKLSLIFLPLFFFDLFSGFNIFPFNFISKIGIRFFPIFFVLWSIIYILEIIKLNKISSFNKPFNKYSLNNYSMKIDELNNKNEKLLSKLKSFNLTEREKEILILLIKGKSYKEISNELSISIATVKTHITNIYKKTDSKHKVDLINKILSQP
ncbi:MAG: helix-turn-helix transcriptional regulator [Spirochaetes bacterium]|nr:helix-turn-helix transcriptional regulator [Spirochaetota bacterium]